MRNSEPAVVPADPAARRAWLEAHYGNHAAGMSPWERVECALSHQEPDRVPFDFWAVPEVWQTLRAGLDVPDDETVLRLLGIDCRMVTTRYVGSKARELPDGTFIGPWGTHRRQVRNEFGSYDEYASHPLAAAETVADVLDWDWASPDDWDVSAVADQCRQFNSRHSLPSAVRGGRDFRVVLGLAGL